MLLMYNPPAYATGRIKSWFTLNILTPHNPKMLITICFAHIAPTDATPGCNWNCDRDAYWVLFS